MIKIIKNIIIIINHIIHQSYFYSIFKKKLSYVNIEKVVIFDKKEKKFKNNLVMLHIETFKGKKIK